MQINLKFQNDFYELAKNYADSRGYMSIQELVRESLRDKIYNDLELKQDYKNVLDSEEANTFSDVNESKKLIEKLRLKAENEKV